jgi:hypothetical protein
MYLLTYFSENVNQHLVNNTNEEIDNTAEQSNESESATKEHIFISADLWNVHKHKKGFHTTVRTLHSWE